MERLEGKYFENTIAALKQVKNAENFELNPSFKAKLRAELVGSADLLAEETQESGLLDLVGRFKYVFGAVPMLAVFVLVFAQFSNWQVKVPTEQIKPDEMKGNVLNNAQPIETMEMKMPSIQTFSADSVMPPQDVLDKMWSNQTESVDTQSEAKSVEQSVTSDTAKLPQLKIKDPQIEVSGSDTLKENQSNVMPTNDSFIQATSLIIPVDETLPTENQVEANTANSDSLQNTVPVEQQGRVEDSGKVVDSVPALMMEKTVIDPIDTQIPPVESAPVNTNQLDIASNQKVETTSTDLTVTQKEATTQMTEETSARAMMVVPVSLSADKIAYQSENRTQVVSAVLKAFADRDGSLSNDYAINVTAREDGTYKAVLFELGRVTKVVIFTYKDGILVVLTELNY